jgi:periplasmic protein TonB
MVPAPDPEDRPVFLRNCLVEGDSEFERRASRGKRRAILISIVLQILIVAALVLFPLLSKSENIAGRVLVWPSVPYGRGGKHPRQTTRQHPPRSGRPVCRFCQPDHIPVGIVTRDQTPPQQNPDDNFDDSEMSRYSTGDGDSHGMPFSDSTHGPKPPDEQTNTGKPTTVRRRISEPVQAAMLIHRVEPSYPLLARQLHREGRVELRAIIATDGTIQALEVITGDSLLIQSALAAVREWRYRPTILDGQPVEVETQITVIYSMPH